MTKTEHEKILQFGIATSFLIDEVEDLLEEYECEEELTDKQLNRLRKRLRVFKEQEQEFKKVLGI